MKLITEIFSTSFDIKDIVKENKIQQVYKKNLIGI